MSKQGKTIMASVQVVYYHSSHGYWVEAHPQDLKQQYRAGPFLLDDAIEEAHKRLNMAVTQTMFNDSEV